MHTQREGFQFAPKINFLGRAGQKLISGLRVAFLSGKDIKPHDEKTLKIKNYEELYTSEQFVQNDIEKIGKEVKDFNVDLLLTCCWPYNLYNHTEYFFNILYNS